MVFCMLLQRYQILQTAKFAGRGGRVGIGVHGQVHRSRLYSALASEVYDKLKYTKINIQLSYLI